MAENPSRKFKPKTEKQFAKANPDPDRLPTHQELLNDLTKYHAKPDTPRELPAVSRRTRDFLITAGVGSAGIVFALVKLMSHSDAPTAIRLALTAVAVFCGLLWYIFYGVMNRY